MAAAVKARFDVEPEVVEGARGSFEVYLDENRLFSKLAEGRFPEDDEILALVSKR